MLIGDLHVDPGPVVGVLFVGGHPSQCGAQAVVEGGRGQLAYEPAGLGEVGGGGLAGQTHVLQAGSVLVRAFCGVQEHLDAG
ncbi:hypothetical protein, partial [uncultured Pseudokineococcus sp.]|uniref:hypothetical protein n=1 Tax=uncultured Pseudokineococcus sp. TaxID=1642928 RepID=UPI002606A457